LYVFLWMDWGVINSRQPQAILRERGGCAFVAKLQTCRPEVRRRDHQQEKGAKMSNPPAEA
jgi:hypothetical protein